MVKDDAARTTARKRYEAYASIEAGTLREEEAMFARYGDLPRCPFCGAMRTNYIFRSVCTSCGAKEV